MHTSIQFTRMTHYDPKTYVYYTNLPFYFLLRLES